MPFANPSQAAIARRVVDAAAAEAAQRAGIFTVMGRCIYRDRAALG
jgi:hypothetical protein